MNGLPAYIMHRKDEIVKAYISAEMDYEMRNMVILCPKCQAINPDDSSTCYKCGTNWIPKAKPYSINRISVSPLDAVWVLYLLIFLIPFFFSPIIGLVVGFVFATIFLIYSERADNSEMRSKLRKIAIVFVVLTLLFNTVVIVLWML